MSYTYFKLNFENYNAKSNLAHQKNFIPNTW